MEKEINKTWFYNQSPEVLWDYLTKSELIEQWLMKNNFLPIVGHQFQFTFVPKTDSRYDGTVNCEVLEVNPFTKLSYTWNGKAKDGSSSFNSTVVWTLVTKGNGTELQLQHHGLTILEDILNHTNGWNSCLKKIEELLTKSENVSNS